MLLSSSLFYIISVLVDFIEQNIYINNTFSLGILMLSMGVPFNKLAPLTSSVLELLML